MSTPAEPHRAYESPLRRAQATATRVAVLEAARALFVEQGYVHTTITAIAHLAQVSPETVYATFGTKRALMSAVVDRSIGGDDEPVPLLKRPWVQALRDERDPGRRIRLLAKNGRMILERITPVYEVLRGAAAADPEIEALWERYKGLRFAGQRELVRILRTGNPRMRAGVSLESAADLLFTIGSPETYRLLTADRGWTPARFERWFADTLTRLLLA